MKQCLVQCSSSSLLLSQEVTEEIEAEAALTVEASGAGAETEGASEGAGGVTGEDSGLAKWTGGEGLSSVTIQTYRFADAETHTKLFALS